MYHAGKRQPNRNLSPDKIIGAFCGVVVKNKEVDKYVNDFFYAALESWYYTKLWGLANGNVGWANEPLQYVQAITILESEQKAIEAEQHEKMMEESKKKSAGKKTR